MTEPPKREPLVIERFEYRGFHGCQSFCKLQVLPLADGRTAVIATELEDNPGTSVTNVAEQLASFVCDRFGIDPDHLVWIEHYGYPSATRPKEPRSYDLVTFWRPPPEKIRWLAPVLRARPDGWPGYSAEPEWREMTAWDWKELGVEPAAAAVNAPNHR